MSPRIDRIRNRSFVDSPNSVVVRAEKKKISKKKSAVARLKSSEKTYNDLLKKAAEAWRDVDVKKVLVEDASAKADIVANAKSNLVNADKLSIGFVVGKLTNDERYLSIGIEIVAACSYGHRGGLTQQEIADKIRIKGADLALVIEILVNGRTITKNNATGRFLAPNFIRNNLSLRPAPEEDDSDNSDDSDGSDDS
jgi:hypothetical protein